ncbi:MAG: hypothetical protein EBR82_77175, partial [Caulobacteraceae bacterium]|nr:hypothetical protein [Caulobacteraceae bacterium]
MFQELGARKAAQELGKAVGTSAGVSAAVGSGVRAITGGEVTPGTVAEDALFGALYAGLGSGSRVKGYNFEEFKDLNYKVKAGRATPAETRDWQQILNEAQRTEATGVERAKRTEVQLGGRTVLDKVNLEGGAPTQVRPYYEPLPAPTSTEIQVARPQPQERPIKPATVISQEQLPEAGVRGNVRGTQADTAAMQRRGIITPMQESLVDLNDPVPKTNVFTTESQGINREAIIPDTRGLQGEIVREGPIVTPRTQLPSGERLALPAEGEFRPTRKAEEAAAVIELEKGMEERIRQSPQGQRGLRKDLEAVAVPEQVQEQIELPNKVKVNIIAPDQETANLVRQKIEQGQGSLLEQKQIAAENAKANLDAIGPEPTKPRPEKKWFGPKGKEGADPRAVIEWEDQTRRYNAWKRKYSVLKKAEVEANNAVFYEQKKQPTIPRPMRGKSGEAGFIVSDVQEGAAKVAQ